jgi:hypothetical protein
MSSRATKIKGDRSALQAARLYRATGLSFLPVRLDGTKAPDGNLLPSGEWTPLQGRQPTDKEVARWFDRPDPRGIGVIGGKVSGHLEVIDFDERAAELFPAWRELVEAEAPGLMGKLTIVRTPREGEGYHVAYRCREVEIPGNLKLATEPYTDPKDGKEKHRTCIETRGEGGYFVAADSPLGVHENGRPYAHHGGPRLSKVTGITAAEREILHRCARCFDKPESKWVMRATGRPGDEFDQHGPDWDRILVPHGWRCVRTSGAVRYWCRPGKDGPGWSATTGFCKGEDGSDLLHIFSSNAHPFEMGHAYGKFRAFALLEHDGDLSATAGVLAGQGYGGSGDHQGNGKPQGNSRDSRDIRDDPWEDPVPLSELPDVAAFPVEVLPQALQELVGECAAAMNVPPDFVALPVLTLGGGAIGNARHVAITASHVQAPCLFAGFIGRPGTTKSAPLRVLRRPFTEAGQRYQEQWKKDMKVWKESDGDDPRPQLRRTIVSDTTMASLAMTLEDNPRGVNMVRNELSALVAGMDQFKRGGRGDDRQNWLNLWDGEPIVIDRKTDREREGAPLQVSAPFVSIVGTLQPEVVKTMRGERRGGMPPPDDGLLDRFVFAWPAELPAVGEQWREVGPDLSKRWADVVERLLALEMQTDKKKGHTFAFGPRPWLVKLSPCGREAWGGLHPRPRGGDERGGLPPAPLRPVVETPRLLRPAGADRPLSALGVRQG